MQQYWNRYPTFYRNGNGNHQGRFQRKIWMYKTLKTKEKIETN